MPSTLVSVITDKSVVSCETPSLRAAEPTNDWRVLRISISNPDASKSGFQHERFLCYPSLRFSKEEVKANKGLTRKNLLYGVGLPCVYPLLPIEGAAPGPSYNPAFVTPRTYLIALALPQKHHNLKRGFAHVECVTFSKFAKHNQSLSTTPKPLSKPSSIEFPTEKVPCNMVLFVLRGELNGDNLAKFFATEGALALAQYGTNNAMKPSVAAALKAVDWREESLAKDSDDYFMGLFPGNETEWFSEFETLETTAGELLPFPAHAMKHLLPKAAAEAAAAVSDEDALLADAPAADDEKKTDVTQANGLAHPPSWGDFRTKKRGREETAAATDSAVVGKKKRKGVHIKEDPEEIESSQPPPEIQLAQDPADAAAMAGDGYETGKKDAEPLVPPPPPVAAAAAPSSSASSSSAVVAAAAKPSRLISTFFQSPNKAPPNPVITKVAAPLSEVATARLELATASAAAAAAAVVATFPTDELKAENTRLKAELAKLKASAPTQEDLMLHNLAAQRAEGLEHVSGTLRSVCGILEEFVEKGKESLAMERIKEGCHSAKNDAAAGCKAIDAQVAVVKSALVQDEAWSGASLLEALAATCRLDDEIAETAKLLTKLHEQKARINLEEKLKKHAAVLKGLVKKTEEKFDEVKASLHQTINNNIDSFTCVMERLPVDWKVSTEILRGGVIAAQETLATQSALNKQAGMASVKAAAAAATKH